MGCYKLHTEDYFLPLRVVKGDTYKKIRVNARDIGAAEKIENGKKLYIIKDHLGNVRVVITEEQQQDVYPAATLEPALVEKESEFYAIDPSRFKLQSEIPSLNNPVVNYWNNNITTLQKPNNNTSCTGNLCTTDNSTKLYRLKSSEAKTGLGITLKVMAGDKIDVAGKSHYYEGNQVQNSPNNLPILDIITGFLGGATGAAATSLHGVVTPGQIDPGSTNLNVNNFFNEQNNQHVNSGKPRAFINVLFFDEQFKVVDFKVSMVGVNGEVKDHFNDPQMQNILAQKSGFVYIYCSNESNINVYFDNVQVVHTRGAMLQESHYYPFGLKMEGISSRAAGGMVNKDKTFQGQKFDDDLGVNYYGFKWRNHDPQIGRFIELDPLSEKYEYNSTYAFSENKVTNHVELEGLEAVSAGSPMGYLVEGFREMLQAGGSVIDKTNPFRGGEVHNNTEAKVSVSGNLASGGSVETSATVTLTERSTSFTVGSFEELFKSGKGPIQFSSTNSTMTKLEQKNAFNTIIRGVPTELFQKTTVDKKSTMVSAGAKANTSSLLDKSKLEAGAELYYRNQPFGIGSGKSAGVKISADATVVVKQFQLQTPVINVKAVVQQKYGGSLFFGYNF